MFFLLDYIGYYWIINKNEGYSGGVQEFWENPSNMLTFCRSSYAHRRGVDFKKKKLMIKIGSIFRNLFKTEISRVYFNVIPSPPKGINLGPPALVGPHWPATGQFTWRASIKYEVLHYASNGWSDYTGQYLELAVLVIEAHEVGAASTRQHYSEIRENIQILTVLHIYEIQCLNFGAKLTCDLGRSVFNILVVRNFFLDMEIIKMRLGR